MTLKRVCESATQAVVTDGNVLRAIESSLTSLSNYIQYDLDGQNANSGTANRDTIVPSATQ